MVSIELIYAPDCPNVALARDNLRAALVRAGVRPAWLEHRIGDAAVPPHARGYGSPTILVDGRDVAGLPPSGEASCRVYPGPAGLAHAPSVEQIVAALASPTSPS